MELYVVIIAPIVLLLLPRIWDDFVAPWIKKRRGQKDDENTGGKPEQSEGPVVQGMTIDLGMVTGVALSSLQEQVIDGREDLEREHRLHARCDALLIKHGIEVPHEVYKEK